MKKIILSFFAFMLLASCAPQYTASFQKYDRPSYVSYQSGKVTKPEENQMIQSVKEEPVLIASIKENQLLSKPIPNTLSTILESKKSKVVSNAAVTKYSKTEIKKAAKEIKKEFKASASDSGKSQIAATLLAFFLGPLGIHRFYLGYTVIGIIQLLTLGGLGIWALIDFIRIIMGDLKPKDGDYTSKF